MQFMERIIDFWHFSFGFVNTMRFLHTLARAHLCMCLPVLQLCYNIKRCDDGIHGSIVCISAYCRVNTNTRPQHYWFFFSLVRAFSCTRNHMAHWHKSNEHFYRMHAYPYKMKVFTWIQTLTWYYQWLIQWSYSKLNAVNTYRNIKHIKRTIRLEIPTGRSFIPNYMIHACLRLWGGWFEISKNAIFLLFSIDFKSWVEIFFLFQVCPSPMYKKVVFCDLFLCFCIQKWTLELIFSQKTFFSLSFFPSDYSARDAILLFHFHL